MLADAILFDLDGTLWDSVDEIIYAWNAVIARHPGLRKPISRAEQEGVMGLQMDEIARRLFADQTSEKQKELMSECCEEEQRYLAIHGGTLYDGLEETLTELNKKYKLCIVSNCQCGYIETFLNVHNLSKYFDDFICFGQTGKSKGESNQIIIARNGFQHPVYVGDTAGDHQAAKDAGIPFIFAEYGFGNTENADAVIHSLPELLRIMG